MKKLGFLLITYLFISGCLDYAKMPADELVKHFTIRDSDFDSNIKYAGPELNKTKYDSIFTGYDYCYYLLRGWRDKKTDFCHHQLYIRIKYSGEWRYYESANFADSQYVKLAILRRNVDDCDYIGRYAGTICDFSEILGVDLTKQLYCSPLRNRPKYGNIS